MTINIRVIPRAKQEKIEITPKGLKVYFPDPALEGRANKKLVEMLAEYYQVKKYDITIIKGEKIRDKVVEIKG